MLFKILKGDSSRISTEKTPFNEGYAYFTPDDAGFYIDTVVNSTQKRMRINERSKAVNATLTAAGWSDKKQVVTVAGMTAQQNGSVGLAQGATDAQIDAARKAALYVCAQADGSLTVAAKDTVPTVGIPIVVTLLF